jgi:hypothetical protein
LAVHNNTQSPMSQFEGLVLSPGFAADVGVTRTYYYKQSSPYSDCVTDGSRFNSTYYYLATNGTSNGYSRKLCYEICLQYEFISSNCSCIDTSVLTTASGSVKTYCNTQKELKCVDDMRNYFNQHSLGDTCAAYYPTECDRFSYSTSVSMADYPTNYYYNVIKSQENLVNLYKKWNETMSFEAFKKSTLLVNVFYKDLVYEAIIENPALTFDQVIGVLGKQKRNFTKIYMLKKFNF